jgi:hypothetical protein
MTREKTVSRRILDERAQREERKRGKDGVCASGEEIGERERERENGRRDGGAEGER